MTLLVVGSVAYDTVETRSGASKDALGGSATYCSLAAKFFTDVSVVGVVGDDFLDTITTDKNSGKYGIRGTSTLAPLDARDMLKSQRLGFVAQHKQKDCSVM